MYFVLIIPSCTYRKRKKKFGKKIEIVDDILIYINIKWVFQIDMITHAARETLKCLNTTEHESYINVCMQQQEFFYFANVWRTIYFFKKKGDHGFLSYTKHYLPAINQQQAIWLLGLGLVKNLTCLYKKANFSIIGNITCLHVCMFYVFHFFKIIIVSLFLDRHD